MDCIEANRRLEPLRNEFGKRYYRWAEQELNREIDSGFARVRRVKSSRAFHYQEFLLDLDPAERPKAARALFKKGHEYVLKQLEGNGLSTKEQEYVERFQRRFYPVAGLSQAEFQLLQSFPETEFELGVEELELSIKSATSMALRQDPIKGRPYLFRQQVGCWFIQTSIDVHSIYQLRYEHAIVARDANDLCPVHLSNRGISLLSWLGIHQSTDFSRLRRSEIHETAAFVADTIHHFILSAPGLLEGLLHDIPAELDFGTHPRRGKKP